MILKSPLSYHVFTFRFDCYSNCAEEAGCTEQGCTSKGGCLQMSLIYQPGQAGAGCCPKSWALGRGS